MKYRIHWENKTTGVKGQGSVTNDEIIAWRWVDWMNAQWPLLRHCVEEIPD